MDYDLDTYLHNDDAMVSAYAEFGGVRLDFAIAYPRTDVGAIALITVLCALGGVALLVGATSVASSFAFAPLALAIAGVATFAFGLHVARVTSA